MWPIAQVGNAERQQAIGLIYKINNGHPSEDLIGEGCMLGKYHGLDVGSFATGSNAFCKIVYLCFKRRASTFSTKNAAHLSFLEIMYGAIK
jgi:hypothetical protein